MKHESASPGFAETQTQTDSEQLLRQSMSDYLGFPAEDAFIKLCVDRRLNPLDDFDKPAYWEAVADYGHQLSTTARVNGEDERKVALQELLLATPNFIYEQSALSGLPGAAKEADYIAKLRVSEFHTLINRVARACPDLRVSHLTHSLISLVGNSIEDDKLKHASPKLINSAVHGIQHEVAFGQLLSHTGRAFREATINEDINRGFDYVVEDRGGPLRLDVKASLPGPNTPYVIESDHTVKIFSQIGNKEFKDRFVLTEELAAERGEHLDRVLDEVSFNLSTALVA